MSPTQRTSIELYRDLLRLINHIAPGISSPKSIALRTMVRSEFNKSRLLLSNISDAAEREHNIEGMKANAIRALSNYMLYEGGVQDQKKGGKLGAAMEEYHTRNVREMKTKTNSNNSQRGVVT